MKPTKKLFIHIGHYKTGTTAIQTFLGSNKSSLADNGINYCSTNFVNSKHSQLAFSLLKSLGVEKQLYGYNSDLSPQSMWSELSKEITLSPHETNIISSEEFIRLGGVQGSEQLLDDIKNILNQAGIEVSIIVYFRNQRDHLKSWYNQLIKMNFDTAPLDHMIRGIEPIHYNYKLAIEPWLRVFSKDKVFVRPYPSSSLGKQYIIKDFLSIIEPNIAFDGFKFSDSDPNPRVEPRILEMLRIISNQGFPKATSKSIQKNWDNFHTKEARTLKYTPNHSDDEIQTIADDANLWLNHEFSLDLDEKTQIIDLMETYVEQDEAIIYDSFVLRELIALRQQVISLKKELNSMKKTS